MTLLEVRIDPSEFGFDPRRLERIQSHFDAYVHDRRLSGWVATVSRAGELVWCGKAGHLDREHDIAVRDDAIWRIYSMTKPITSVAVMMLYEEGRFDLNDDVGQWIEELRSPRVYVSGTPNDPVTAPASEPVRVHHLLTHTSGLTYGFNYLHPVDAMYRKLGYDFGWKNDADLARAVHDWCSTPLLFEPGSHWNYSVATDVLGRLIEIWSGQTLDQFIRERLTVPLAMHDTEWWCPPEKRDRLAMLYVPYEGDSFRYEEYAAPAERSPRVLSGGAGLLSTAYDYNRFMTMLLRGGELDGVRYLSRRTLDLMTQNHLPHNADLEEFAVDSFSETATAGKGFGLGFSVVIDQVKNKSLISEGSYAWGGAASTAFWIDPAEDLSVGFFTQLLPSSTYPIRRELEQLVYQALVD